MDKQGVKSRRNKHPKQIYLDDETKVQFEALIADYDEPSAAAVIIKLIKNAIKEWALPGYVKKEKKVIDNDLMNTLNKLGGKKNNS
jgi:hypothetical protein